MDINNHHTCSFKNFLGDDTIRPHVTFSRKGVHFCIYCGNPSDTREHSPSKVFLSKPYLEEELPVLPACKSCNNAFSADELYTELYIDSIKYLSGYSNSLSERNREHVYTNSAFLDAQNDITAYFNGGDIPINHKVVRILTKLAVCHMIYELSEGYAIDDACVKPTSVSYSFAFDMPQNIIEEYAGFVCINDKQIPEMGSRVFDNIFVVEEVVESEESAKTLPAQMIVMDWHEIQEGNYRYIAWLENDTFCVRIVIHDFLYAEILFDRT